MHVVTSNLLSLIFLLSVYISIVRIATSLHEFYVQAERKVSVHLLEVGYSDCTYGYIKRWK
jgi:hypothetical protein